MFTFKHEINRCQFECSLQKIIIQLVAQSIVKQKLLCYLIFLPSTAINRLFLYSKIDSFHKYNVWAPFHCNCFIVFNSIFAEYAPTQVHHFQCKTPWPRNNCASRKISVVLSFVVGARMVPALCSPWFAYFLVPFAQNESQKEHSTNAHTAIIIKNNACRCELLWVGSEFEVGKVKHNALLAKYWFGVSIEEDVCIMYTYSNIVYNGFGFYFNKKRSQRCSYVKQLFNRPQYLESTTWEFCALVYNL